MNASDSRIIWLLAAGFLLGTTVVGRSDHADRRAPDVRILTISGQWITGELLDFAASGPRVRSGDNIQVPDWIRAEFPAARSEPSTSPKTWIELTNGDRLAVSLVSASPEGIRAHRGSANDAQAFTVPLEFVQSISWDLEATPPIPMNPTQASSAAASLDVATLVNGDTVSGEFVAISRRELTMDSAAGAVLHLPLERVRRLQFSPLLLTRDGFAAARGLVQLEDGSWLSCQSWNRTESGQWSVIPVFADGMEMPDERIRSIRRQTRRFVPLSSLSPEEYRSRPYFGGPHPLERNRSAALTALQVNGSTWPRGLGVRSRCELTYQLQQQFERFQSELGLDDVACERGDVTYQILVDGQVVVQGALDRSRRDHSIVTINFDIQGARTMQLIVDYGRNGDICDVVDWLDPVLIRPGETDPCAE